MKRMKMENAMKKSVIAAAILMCFVSCSLAGTQTPSDLLTYDGINGIVQLQGVDFNVTKEIRASMAPLAPHDWRSDISKNFTSTEGISMTLLNFSNLEPIIPTSILNGIKPGVIPTNVINVDAGAASGPVGGYGNVFNM
jgi:hypothetical protein